MGSILDNIYNKAKMIRTPNATKLNFNQEWQRKLVREAISEVANTKDEKGNTLVPAKDQKMVTDAVMRLLVNYDNADLSNPAEREIIAQ